MDILARVTELPTGFIAVVLLVMETGGNDFSLQFADLITVINLHPEDFKKLEDALDALMDDYRTRWMRNGVRSSQFFGEDISSVEGVSGG